MTEIAVVGVDGIQVHKFDFDPVVVYCDCRDELVPECDGGGGECECWCHPPPYSGAHQ